MFRSIFYLSIIIFLFSCSYNHVCQISSSTYKINNNASELLDSSILTIVKPYKDSLDTKMNQTIAYCETELTKAQPESTLGNWVCDAIQSVGSKYFNEEIDFSIVNYGGLRIPGIQAGNVNIGTIYELMPFDNALVVVELDSANVNTLMEHMAAKGGWPVSKSISYFRERNNLNATILINGKKLNNKSLYRVLMSDYIANGGDACSFLIGSKRTALNILFRDALIEYCVSSSKAGLSINAALEKRIVLPQ